MLSKYSCYSYEIYNDIELTNEPENTVHWVYNIYNYQSFGRPETAIRSSDQWYDSEDEAHAAAVEHIDALENGER